MLVFIDEENNIKVYLQVRKIRTITMTYKVGKCVLSAPYKLDINKIKNIYYTNIDIAKKYAVDYNNLHLYLLGNKYRLRIYGSVNKNVYIDEDTIYCAVDKLDENYKVSIDVAIKYLKEFYNKIIEEEINKIKDKVILKIKDVFNVDLSYITIDFKYATTYFGCNDHKKITISSILAKYDRKYYEYILAHEYIHQFAFNHGDDFYNKLLKIYPDYLIIMKKLKNKGKEFSFSII